MRNDMATYRALTADEVKKLESQGCFSPDWAQVQVTEGIDLRHLCLAVFLGSVKLGKLSGLVEVRGVKKPSGIFQATLSNVTVGDGARIANIGSHVANYEIGAGAVIEDVGLLAVEGESSFGNGIDLEVLNEGGGRELPMTERLSAQLAYLVVCRRERPALVNKLRDLLKGYAAAQKKSVGSVGEKALVIGCGEIVNVKIGAGAKVMGAIELKEGAISCTVADPTTVGAGVIAKDFIILSGSKVEGSAILEKVFVGQGVQIGEQFSAKHSAFFANCEGFHGEACSWFAGPYSVTHHKGTLMIALLTSFYNAGSATNQSNHMYKLGPLHQGILDRGSKTGSGSYLLLPSRIGAFSVVIGKHYSNFDVSDMPFSYVNDIHGESWLMPAMNLITVGTRRDGDKWPARDRRKGEKIDLITFPVFNPYTISRMIAGGAFLEKAYAETPRDKEFINYNGIKLNRGVMRTTKKYYELAIKCSLGAKVVERLGTLTGQTSLDTAKKKLAPTGTAGVGAWVDLLGLLAPASEVDAFAAKVEKGEFKDLAAAEKAMKGLYDNYAAWEWNWTLNAWETRLGKKLADMTMEDIAKVVAEWKENAMKLNSMILKDAEKEFDQSSRVSFGPDGDAAARDVAFEAVRGTYEGNKFIKQLRKEMAEIEQKGDALLAVLK